MSWRSDGFSLPFIAVFLVKHHLDHVNVEAADKIFVWYLVSVSLKAFQWFMKLLGNNAQVSVSRCLLFACLFGPIYLCAVISHRCSVQTELWAATPPNPPKDRQRRTERNPVWPSADAEWRHLHKHSHTHVQSYTANVHSQDAMGHLL